MGLTRYLLVLFLHNKDKNDANFFILEAEKNENVGLL